MQYEDWYFTNEIDKTIKENPPQLEALGIFTIFLIIPYAMMLLMLPIAKGLAMLLDIIIWVIAPISNPTRKYIQLSLFGGYILYIILMNNVVSQWGGRRHR
jgi:hypothetical protein